MNKSLMQLLVLVIATFLVAKAFSYSLDDAKGIYWQIIDTNKIQNAPNITQNYTSDVNAQRIFILGISINTGMLSFVRNKDELALVLGHEIAHWLNGDTVSNYKTEYAADKLGAYLAKRAGFNVCIGKRILLRLNSGEKHPPAISRYQAIKC